MSPMILLLVLVLLLFRLLSENYLRIVHESNVSVLVLFQVHIKAINSFYCCFPFLLLLQYHHLSILEVTIHCHSMVDSMLEIKQLPRQRGSLLIARHHLVHVPRDIVVSKSP